jgi:hypothetical protein
MFWLACTDVFDIEKVRPAVFGRVEVLEGMGCREAGHATCCVVAI